MTEIKFPKNECPWCHHVISAGAPITKKAEELVSLEGALPQQIYTLCWYCQGFIRFDGNYKMEKIDLDEFNKLPDYVKKSLLEGYYTVSCLKAKKAQQKFSSN